MKTCVHLCQFLAEFVLKWEMFKTRVIEKIKTFIVSSITFSRKSCRLWDNVEKYGTARQATDDNIIRRMRFACWISKATDTHSECVILLLFHGNNGYANAPQCYVIRKLPVLLLINMRTKVQYHCFQPCTHRGTPMSRACISRRIISTGFSHGCRHPKYDGPNYRSCFYVLLKKTNHSSSTQIKVQGRGVHSL
jgi:hypothetical protein